MSACVCTGVTARGESSKKREKGKRKKREMRESVRITERRKREVATREGTLLVAHPPLCKQTLLPASLRSCALKVGYV